jgi:hypothetical protein
MAARYREKAFADRIDLLLGSCAPAHRPDRRLPCMVECKAARVNPRAGSLLFTTRQTESFAPT